MLMMMMTTMMMIITIMELAVGDDGECSELSPALGRHCKSGRMHSLPP